VAGLPLGFPGWLAMCAVVLVTRNLLECQRSVSTLIVQVSVEDALRRRLYRAIANADWLFIARSRSSDFLYALTSEIERVSICVFAAMLLGGELALPW
jgi:ABC-type siderophore export system fused ATPase/permease subunit